jgi:hypothetical protein
VILNAPHAHLVLNHAPLFTTLFALALLFYGWRWKSRTARLAAYGMLVIAAAATVPVFLSGSASENVVEKMPGVLKSLIDLHEDAARMSLSLIVATGALAAGAWVVEYRVRAVPRALLAFTFALAALATASFGYTALLGGQIHHPEIRPAASPAANPADADRD